MAEAQILPVPFLTSQNRSAHPFYVGPEGQTAESENLWVDDQLNVNRRPATYRIGDYYQLGRITGMFEYEYKDRAANPVKFFMGFTEPESSSSVEGGISILTNKPFGRLLNSSSTTVNRMLLRGASVAHTTTAYGHREACTLLDGASAGSSTSGDSIGTVFVMANNVDTSVPDGNVVLASVPSGFNNTLHTAPFRLLGLTSGANVHFLGPLTSLAKRQAVWQVDAANYIDNSVPVFAQFGRFLINTDDSHQFPARIWSGGAAAADFLRQAPTASIVFIHQSRVWLTGLERNGAEIIGSGINDPYSWSTERRRVNDPISLELEQEDRDKITGASQSYRGDLYVWKNKSLHRITGLIRNAPEGSGPEFARQTVTRSIGCASHRSIVHVGNDIFWMSDKGVHSLGATEKFGDVETSYISFPIADAFEDLNFGMLQKSQAVYHPRLGLYILGVPRSGSTDLNRIMAYSVASKRWMTWDVGNFSALAIGPPLGREAESVYISLVGPTNQLGELNVLDFTSFTDYSNSITDDALDKAFTEITTKIEPGDLFVSQTPELRYFEKKINRIKFYLRPSGPNTSTVKYAWDGREEQSETLDLNPTKDGAATLNDTDEGNALASENDTLVSSIPIQGTGTSFRFRIEDSNPGRLPYLHSDVEFEVTSSKYSQQSRKN